MQRLLRTYESVANQGHFCDRCCSDIRPGEIYEGEVYSLGKGKLVVYKYHVEPMCDEPEEPEDEELTLGLRVIKSSRLEKSVKKEASKVA